MMNPFLKEVAADLFTKFGTDIQDYAIVFNNKRPIAYLQKYLAEIVGKPFFSPSFFTIQDFFSNATERKIADPYMQFFTLLNIYNQLLVEEGLKQLNSSHFYPIAKILLSDFNQIDSDLVDTDKLYKELEDISVINLEFDFLTPEQYQFLSQFWASYSEGKHKEQQKYFIQMWRRMPKLYHRFHEALSKKNYTTHGSAYRMLAGMEIAELQYLQKFKKIIFVGFNALSLAEATLFTKLQQAEKVLFYFDTDDYYLKDNLQEAGTFLRKNIYQLQLKNELTTSSNFLNICPHKADVYKVQGQAAQAKILNQLLEEEYIADNNKETTAIVLADEALLIPALQTIPIATGKKEIRLNITMGFPLAVSSIFGLANLWLQCQQEISATTQKDKEQKKNVFIPYHFIESFLTHPLIHLPQSQKNKIRTAIVKENKIQVEHHRLIRQGGILATFFAPVSDSQNLVPALAELLKNILFTLSSNKILKEIDAQLFATVIKELNQFNDSISAYLNEKEELSFIISLTQKVLQGITVPLSGDPLEGIQLMGLLESRNLNFDNVIFLGFNEGIIPKTSIGNSFIPDSLRRVYGLPVLENLDAISAYIAYRLMQRAKNISIVYNSLTDETASGEPSRFLKQLEYESGFQFNYHNLHLSVKTQSSEAITIDKKHPFIQKRLKEFLDKKREADYAGNTKEVEVAISPTALTMYIANPIDFFFAYIANIKEPEEVSAIVEARELGSILHSAMEAFYSNMKNNSVTKEWITLSRSNNETLIKMAFFKIRKVEDKDIASYEFTGMQTVVLAIVKAYMDIILDEDETYAPFTIIGLEEKIKTEVAFELKGTQQSILLKGFIDRIDEKDGITRIVDYKTGNDKLEFNGDIQKLFDTDDKHINKAMIQTMIYTNVYETLKNKKGVLPVLYILRSMKKDGVQFKQNKLKLEQELLADLKPEFNKAFQNKLAELFDEDIPFRSSQLPDNYTYSIYKTLFEG